MLLNRKSKLLWMLACCEIGFGVSVSKAQKNPYNEVSIASPTAASLGKYADIPVSYHTGLPQISVPIYSVKEGPLQIPISLSYHASGVQVLEAASWAGLGWSLNAGGVITRTVRGAPDERGTSSVDNQTKGHLSDGGYNKYAYYIDGSQPNGVAFDDYRFALGQLDGEPDMFSFNFGGYSGKFYFQDDGTVITVPSQDIKIEYLYTGVGSIENFTCTTPDGTKYYFGKTASTGDIDPIERTNPFNAQSGFVTGTVISSWYLNKITSADGVFSINLSYVAENYGKFTISTFPVPFDNTSNANPDDNYEYQLVKDIISGVRLSQITFSNGRVDFIANTIRTDLSGNGLTFSDDANTQAKALDSIKIWNGGSNCKKYVLAYDYFQDNASALPGYFTNYSITSDRKRLRLLSCQELSCDVTATAASPYTFDYFTEFVPRRLNFGQDHWGFINGVTGSNTLIPTYTVNETTTITGADRDAHWPAMRGGSLQRINYPTGGNSEFDFEPNYAWVNYNKKQLTTTYYLTSGYDGNSNPSTYYEPFSGNPYQLLFSNSSVGGQATINIYNANNQSMYSATLNQGQSISTILNFIAGTYRIVIQKFGAVSGDGAAVHIDEFATVVVQKNETVGGLRIKTLMHSDGILSQKLTTTYTYESAGKSTGVLYSRPVYVSQVRNDALKITGGYTLNPNAPDYCSPNGCINCDFSGQGYYKSASAIRPMESTQGNHIGYGEVKVRQAGNGYTIYRYFSTAGLDAIQADVVQRNVTTTSCLLSTPSFPYAPLPYDYKRGDLSYEAYFNESGTLLKDVKYGPTYQESQLTTPAMTMVLTPWMLGTMYELKTAKKIIDTVVETSYSNGQTLVNTNLVYYESSYHNRPTRKRAITSKGEVLETISKYAMDFRISNCDAISDCFASYQSALASANYNYTLAYSSCSNHYCRYWTWDLYRKNLAIARQNYVNCRTSYLTGSSSFKQCMTNAKGSSDGQLKPILELREIEQNAPVEVSTWKNSKLLTASFTNYDYSTNPSGKVYPVKIQQVNLSSPSTTFTFASTSSNNLSVTKDSRYEDESTIKFLGGNLSEVKPKSGVTQAYLWDYNNNLPVAKVLNASGAEFAFTSFEADGKGNWTFTSTPGTDLTAPTGTKSYTLGSSITKSGLSTTATYIVSYWKKSGSVAVNATAAVAGRTINGWTYYEHKVVNPSGGLITVSGTNGIIDELRLYPVSAQMTTYSYEPLVGLRSQCDASNMIMYYEYDSYNRLKLIRDMEGNILKTFEYKYQESQTQQ